MLRFLHRLLLKLIGGSRNERLIRAKMQFVAEQINPLEPAMREMSDEQLLETSHELRRRLGQGQTRQQVRPEAFALIREASRRAQNHRQFDVQLVAGTVLDDGNIAEEATGEGKTVACYPAIYMAALEGKKTHVVTTNDYLVQRDAEFAQPVFELLGLSVGYITANMPRELRKQAYACDVTYGTNSEFGFDYLRDNMKLSAAEQVQKGLDFAIIDEVDNILIDEARTPLIISGPARGDTDKYRKADQVARELISRNREYDRQVKRTESLKHKAKALEGELSRNKSDQKLRQQVEQVEQEYQQAEQTLEQMVSLYKVELDKKSAHMTDEGTAEAQEIAGVGSFYVGANIEWPHLMEQALRAHLVFEKDKDYVVQNNQVVIVDEFTGRLMEGREWSDGLHQAVSAKERVPIKQENQTLATITLQNFFRMYDKLAGMTGTAETEATEFAKIYGLDVLQIPTHRPVNRVDYEDIIYADEDNKYVAIVKEVNAVSKAGRPVLVGTTSIEKSERLSAMMTKTFGIEHQVLNARPENAAREADIVAQAGQQRPLRKGSKEMVGTVTIATNMAGRGTDIKLGPGVVYEKCKVPSDQALREMGLEPDPLYPAGVNKCCIHCQQYDPATNCAHCFKPKLDEAFPGKGRTKCVEAVPCGLHVIGTERHEARRIDNQLRGRAGRQGDPASGKFFLSLRDELISLFAPEWMVKMLAYLGVEGQEGIPGGRLKKGIIRAQKKVEERNYERRKNLIEYDEVMDHQRKTFYTQRQDVLEGRDLEGIVREMVAEAIAEAVDDYLDNQYPARCISEWARQNLQVTIDPERIRATSPDEYQMLEQMLRDRAQDEARQTISITLGEYMDPDIPAGDWDLRGLSSWAMSRFGVQLSQNQLRKMSPEQVSEKLTQEAIERIEQIDVTPVAQYLEEDFPRRSLAEWARSQFGLQVEPDQLRGEPDQAIDVLRGQADELYRRREIEYPVEYAMDLTIGSRGADNLYALDALADWANRKYQAGWDGSQLAEKKPAHIYEDLVALSEEWSDPDRLLDAIRQDSPEPATADWAVQYARKRFDTKLRPEDLDGNVEQTLVQVGRSYLRREMTELERFVLLQIYDSAWKDHLLAMDHLGNSIGLRSHAEQDPRVAYKREGSQMFNEMLTGIRNKVTDMIFKVRLAADEQVSNVYQVSNTVHEQLTGYDHLAQEMADQQAAAEPKKVETIVRDTPKVGRNDPCPCGSGKKYKKCCGRA